MGTDSGPASSRPAHWVYLETYEIDATEVTVSAIATYLGQSAATLVVGADFGQTGHPTWPVVGSLWAEAEEYCQWRGARFPTEAEWEKAARGTDGRAYPWGETWDASRSNTSEAGPGHPLSVGSFPEGMSPYGVFDMAGNVAEWVADYSTPRTTLRHQRQTLPDRRKSSTMACAGAHGHPIAGWPSPTSVTRHTQSGRTCASDSAARDRLQIQAGNR
jgi:formylglycine-generating enzyme required for sulfatase activity